MLEFQDDFLLKLENIFKDYNCFLVGGYLRNYFLNNKISYDRDIAVIENSKELALKLAQKINGVFIELDNKNEIYRVVAPDKKNYFDISKIIENDIEKDILRRDFTINSIFYDLNKKEIIDKVNGINDINGT